MVSDVSIINISKHYNHTMALDSVTLDIKKKEFMTLLGPSGSGKTTILMIIAGFIKNDTGRILINSRDITRVPSHRRNIGVVFQNYALFPHMSVKENIDYPLKIRRVPKKKRVSANRHIVEVVRLEGLENRLPSQLSGGQKQRVALARALVFNPPVLLMDEPLSALDKKLREQMQLELKSIQEQMGITVLYVTHDQEEALSMADRVVVIREGQFRQIGSPWEIYKKPKTSFIAEFVGTSNFFEGKKKGDSVIYGQSALKVSEIDTVDSETVYLAIRPEDIEIVGTTIAEESCVAANIVDAKAELITFLGPVVSITVNFEGKELMVDIAQKEFAPKPITVKDPLRLYFPPDAFHVYSEIFRKLI